MKSYWKWSITYKYMTFLGVVECQKESERSAMMNPWANIKFFCKFLSYLIQFDPIQSNPMTPFYSSYILRRPQKFAISSPYFWLYVLVVKSKVKISKTAPKPKIFVMNTNNFKNFYNYFMEMKQTLKYGFCNKVISERWNSDELNTFTTYLSSLLGVISIVFSNHAQKWGQICCKSVQLARISSFRNDFITKSIL